VTPQELTPAARCLEPCLNVALTLSCHSCVIRGTGIRGTEAPAHALAHAGRTRHKRMPTCSHAWHAHAQQQIRTKEGVRPLAADALRALAVRTMDATVLGQLVASTRALLDGSAEGRIKVCVCVCVCGGSEGAGACSKHHGLCSAAVLRKPMLSSLGCAVPRALQCRRARQLPCLLAHVLQHPSAQLHCSHPLAQVAVERAALAHALAALAEAPCR